MKAARDSGYAMVVAVAGIAVFGYIGLQTIASSRAVTGETIARVERARLAAVADAAVAVAITRIDADPSQRWPFNGAPQSLQLDGDDVTVRIQDENAKVPINQLDDAKLRRLFAAVGATGERLDLLVDAFKEWHNGDDSSGTQDASTAYYAQFGLKPRNGDIPTVEELIRLRGMDQALLDRLTPLVSVYFDGDGTFDTVNASPLAAAIMANDQDDTAQGLANESQELAEQPVENTAAATSLDGRSFTIAVETRDPSGAALTRSVVVEFTGNAAEPYQIRCLE